MKSLQIAGRCRDESCNTVLEIFNHIDELVFRNCIKIRDVIYPNTNLKLLVFDKFENFNLSHCQEVVRNFPNMEKLSFKIRFYDSFTADVSKMVVIDALKILFGGLKKLKLLSCADLHFCSAIKITLSLNDVINIIDSAGKLEFFFIRAYVVFDEIYKHFASKFDVVRYENGYLLMSQKEILENIKAEKENRIKLSFPVIDSTLADFFYKDLY